MPSGNAVILLIGISHSIEDLRPQSVFVGNGYEFKSIITRQSGTIGFKQLLREKAIVPLSGPSKDGNRRLGSSCIFHVPFCS